MDTQHDGYGLLAHGVDFPGSRDIRLESGMQVTMVYKREASDFDEIMRACQARYGGVQRVPATIMDGHGFINLLENCTKYFQDGPNMVRNYTGEVSSLLACILEDSANKCGREVEIFENGRLYVAANDAEQDALFRRVQRVLKVTFGRAKFDTWNERASEPFYEPAPPSGQDAFINERKNYLLRNISQVVRPPRDADAKHRLLCRDGWYWDYQLKKWLPNSIITRLWRVCGKTRAQLDDYELVPTELRDLIAHFWAEVKRFEDAGGQNIDEDSVVDGVAVNAAYAAILGHPKSRLPSRTKRTNVRNSEQT